jgi:predicted acetyltransferase
MLDGITSGLIDKFGFENQYNYIYVDISRQQPVDKMTPKSVQLIGENTAKGPIELFVFLEYEAEIKIDKLTGARL